jgi:hypothetical protein
MHNSALLSSALMRSATPDPAWVAARFPEFDKNAWQEAARERHRQTESLPLAYHFVTYQRRK